MLIFSDKAVEYMDFGRVFQEALPMLLDGLWLTVKVSVISIAIGMVIGLFMCLMKMSKNVVLRAIAGVYIWIIRGTPMLVQALMQDPEILILDEPAAGIDFKGEQLLCELLEKFRRKLGFTQLMVSHDLSMVAAHAAHVICINRTVFAAGEPDKVLTTQVLHETFGLHVGKVEMPKHGEVCGCCH